PAERKLRQEAYQAELFRRVFFGVVRLLGAARDERLATVQASWPDLPKVCVNGVDLVEGDFDQSLAVASQTALANRLDLMNARAQLVDSWRQIAVSANSLLGVV